MAHVARRIGGSVAVRGWRATFRRALAGRSGLRDAPDDKGGPIVVASVPAHGPAKRVLVIDTMTPDPNRDSGSMRLCQMFALLHADGWTIDFIADDDDASQRDMRRLAAIGVNVHRGRPRSLLVERGATIDAAILCRLPIADQYIDLVREHAPRARILFDTVDLHFVREQRGAELSGNASLARQAARSRKRELAMVTRADVTLVVSADEQAILAREAPQSSVGVVSNIHDIVGRTAPFSSRTGLIFVGGFGHPPNEDAVRWFADNVLPQLRARDSTLVLHVVGDIDDEARHSIEREGVVVHGRVADLAPLLAQARLSVAPLRFGAGVKGKVNQAMSHGLPVVLTSIAAEGMYIRDGVDALVADDATAMANAISQAYQDEALWLRLSEGGLENVREHFSVSRARDALRLALTPAS
jgi:glycosyltransferase involved in cell wall biosynthesis